MAGGEIWYEGGRHSGYKKIYLTIITNQVACYLTNELTN